jgi:hypothetical protein
MRRITVLAGAAAAVAAVAARVFRSRRHGEAGSRGEAESDPRAGELRERLAESRAVVDEREEFEAAETPVDEVKPVADADERRRDIDERRRKIHERAREAAEDMRRND